MLIVRSTFFVRFVCWLVISFCWPDTYSGVLKVKSKDVHVQSVSSSWRYMFITCWHNITEIGNIIYSKWQDNFLTIWHNILHVGLIFCWPVRPYIKMALAHFNKRCVVPYHSEFYLTTCHEDPKSRHYYLTSVGRHISYSAATVIFSSTFI